MVVLVVLLAGMSGCTSGESDPLPRAAPSTVANTNVIRPENVATLLRVAQWGSGRSRDNGLAGEANLLAVASSLGVFLYDASDLSRKGLVEADPRVDQVALSPDGSLLASTQLPVNGVTLQRIQDGAPLHHLADPGYRIDNLAFSPNGEYLAYVSTARIKDSSGQHVITRFAQLWDTTGKQLASLQPKSATAIVTVPEFSPDSQWMVIPVQDGDTAALMLWDLQNAVSTEVKAVAADGPFSRVVFSPDGAVAAALARGAGGDGDHIITWRTDNWSVQQLLELPTRASSDVVRFSPDGSIIAVAGSGNDPVHLWEADGTDTTWRYRATDHGADSSGPATVFTFSPDGSLLTTATAHALFQWKTGDGSFVWSVDDAHEGLETLENVENGERLLGAEENGRLWARDAATGQVVARNDAHLDLGVNDVAVVATGEPVIAGGSDGTIRFWDVESGQTSTLLTVDGASVDALSLSPDGESLAAALSKEVRANVWDDRVQIWDTSTHALVQELEAPHAPDSIASCSVFRNDVAFSPDGATVASPSYDHHVRVWRTGHGELVSLVEGHELAVVGVGFAPDGSTLASASTDGTVRLWRGNGSGAVETIPDHFAGATSVAYSPDGALLATSDATGQVHIWRAKNGKKLRTLEGLKNNASNLEFSPDGSLLAAGGITGAIEFWETATWQPVHTLAAHRGRVNAVRFSSEGDLFVSGSEDGTIRVWKVPTE